MPASPTAPPAAPTAGDLADPEPAEASFEDYGAYLTAHARWAARDEFQKQQDAVRARAARTQAEQRAQTHAAKLDEQHAALREKFGDADAVIDQVLTTLRDNPRAAAVADFLAESEHSGEVAYRLGKDPAALKAVSTAPSAVAVARELARIEVAIAAPVSAPSHVTKAPAPPSRTVGTSTAASSVDTVKGVSFKEHLRIENEREAVARRAGQRY
jgi:hypothetical protein